MLDELLYDEQCLLGSDEQCRLATLTTATMMAMAVRCRWAGAADAGSLRTVAAHMQAGGVRPGAQGLAARSHGLRVVFMPIEGYYFCCKECVNTYNSYLEENYGTCMVMPDEGHGNDGEHNYLMPVQRRPHESILEAGRSSSRRSSCSNSCSSSRRRSRRRSSSRRSSRRRNPARCTARRGVTPNLLPFAWLSEAAEEAYPRPEAGTGHS